MRVPAGRPPGRRRPPKRDSRDGVACCPIHPYTPANHLIVSTLQLEQQTETLYTYTATPPKPDPYTADPQHVSLAAAAAIQPTRKGVYLAAAPRNSNILQQQHPAAGVYSSRCIQQQHPDEGFPLAAEPSGSSTQRRCIHGRGMMSNGKAC